MNIFEAADLYIKKGWQVVPLLPGGKACKDANWLKMIFQPKHFKDGDNIGLRSVDGLTIIDEDCEEVVQLADHFLPPTKAIYGRKSKPKSKRLYFSTFEKIEAYKDTENGNTLIEIRVKHQDMAPPSTHPSGELLEWHVCDEATKVEEVDLRRAVRLLASASLILRYYNPPGARHDWGLGLAGLLKQLGVQEDEAVKMFQVAGDAAGDRDIEDRLGGIRTTFARGDDDAVQGAKALEDSMDKGKAFVVSLRRIWGSDASLDKKKVELLNETHAMVFQQNGEVVVLSKMEDGEIRFSKPQIMPQVYNEPVVYDYTLTGQPKYKKLGQVWLDSPNRKLFKGIGLYPKDGDCPEGFYNLWNGFSVEPKQGKWPRFKAHLLDVVAQGNKKRAQYILSWMAQCVQKPDTQGLTAIALKGGQGVGKSTFASWFGSLFGPHYLSINSSSQLTGRFNAHFHNSIFVFADEAAWPGDKAGIGALRRMVTEETLTIERKGVDILTVKNHIHLMLASNSDWVVPAALDERRFAVFELTDEHQNDSKWFAEIQRELFMYGGLQALLYDLLNMDISKVNLRMPPYTKELGEQKVQSLDPIHSWWYEKLCMGDLVEGKWPAKVMYAGLHDDYCIYTDKHYRVQRSRKRTQVELGNFLKKFAPGDRQRMMFDGSREIFRDMPSLKKCRSVWTQLTGIEFEV